jgi:3-dehydroquinate synthase
LRVPFDYPVVFTRGLFAADSPLLADTIARLGGSAPKQGGASHKVDRAVPARSYAAGTAASTRVKGRRRRVLVCIDAGVAASLPALPTHIRRYFRTHFRQLELAGPIEILRGGEAAKHELHMVTRIVRWIAGRRLCRHSVVMAIGGGSVLDVAGFAASLAHRGLRLVRVPTTVEAQNDVGVGVKTGIDYLGAKNFLGTFAPPFAVLNDLDFLDTLPTRDWIAGIAEAFKVALIKDRRFFLALCRDAGRLRRRDRAAMERLVITCARLHLDHIRAGGDPFETGSARPLDFGHWSAHQLEVMSGYRLRHGEAVAIGIALDMVVAWKLGLVARADLDNLLDALTASGLPVWSPLLKRRTRAGRLAILDGLTAFREHLGGELTLSLPGPVGRCREIHHLRPSQVAAAIRHLCVYPEQDGRHSCPP